MKNQSGQIVIILLLITLVALSVGLAITQRSLTNLKTSTQNEQSSRAFSAADAGIEKAIQQNSSIGVGVPFDVSSDSSVSVTKNDLPAANQALEYPPIGKETISQFWLENPDTLPSGPPPFPSASYIGNDTVDIYFGRSDIAPTSPESPAIEVNAIVLDTNTSTYSSTRTYIDSTSNASVAGRYPNNGFNAQASCIVFTVATSSSPASKFRCKYPLNITNGAPNLKAVMVRIRTLYTTLNHPIAVDPMPGKSLPLQASVFVSTGTSGQSQKKLQVFRLKYVVPNFFEFSIFSAGDINK